MVLLLYFILILGNTAQQQLQQQQQQQQSPPNVNDLVINSIVNCKLFGDERDQVFCKLNLLQACWGTGKGITYFQTISIFYFTIVRITKIAVGCHRVPQNLQSLQKVVLVLW